MPGVSGVIGCTLTHAAPRDPVRATATRRRTAHPLDSLPLSVRIVPAGTRIFDSGRKVRKWCIIFVAAETQSLGKPLRDQPRKSAVVELTHLDDKGRARMVDISRKNVTRRVARAEGMIELAPETLDRIAAGAIEKGEVLPTARIAGMLAAKRCDELIPLCHTIPLEDVQLDFASVAEPPGIKITAEAACEAKTGAEMEALIAVSIAALTIYDMVKAVDRTATITGIRLVEKSGGRSGRFVRA